MKTCRLFVAIPLSASLRKALYKSISRLSNIPTKVKWVEEENLHITLKFLGNTREDKVEKIVSSLKKALESCHSFSVNLGKIGAFPNVAKPRVIKVGISQGEEEIRSIAEKVEEALEPLGFEKEKRKFSAHITLGRVKSMDNIMLLLRNMQKESYDGLQMKVEKVLLMESKLTKKGPIYSVVEKFSLKE